MASAHSEVLLMSTYHSCSWLLHMQSSLNKGLQLALRFEYIADRAAPGAAPVLHVYNMSRIQRKYKLLSAAYVNGQRLMPGDRGLRLQVSDFLRA